MKPKSTYYSEVSHLFHADCVNRTEPFMMTQYHYHNVHEIHYFLSGERRLFYKDRIYHVMPGDLIIIKKYELHSLCDWDKPGYKRILIDFQNEFFDDINLNSTDIFACFDRDVIVMHPNDEDRSNLENKMIDIVNEFSNKQDGFETMLKLQTAEILILLNRMMNRYTDKRELRSQRYVIVSDIMAYISQNYSEKLTLESLGNQFGYSRNYLCSMFKTMSGFSVVSYINGTRIKKAQEFLKNSKISIAKTAQLCGFDSSTHFGRVFKEIAGCSPMQFRKMTESSAKMV